MLEDLMSREALHFWSPFHNARSAHAIMAVNCFQGDKESALEAANMLWLIQRDFLEGTTVQQMVKAALDPVDNPNRDADIEEVSSTGVLLCLTLVWIMPEEACELPCIGSRIPVSKALATV